MCDAAKIGSFSPSASLTPGRSTKTPSSGRELGFPGSNPAWHFTVVTSAFTLGNVFAPFTLSAGGWTWGSLFWLYSSITTWWSGILIGRCVIDGAKRGVGSSYSEMMADAFGQRAYWFTVLMQIATYFTLSSTLIVNFASWLMLAWQILWGTSGPCQWHWIMFAGAVLTVLSQIRTFRQVLPLALLSLSATFVRQFLLYYQIAAFDLVAQCEPRYGGVGFRSAVTSLSTTAFLFGGHGMFPEEIREMKRKEQYFNALHAAYVLICVVYFTNAYVAYFVWGDWAAADIQFNWPRNDATLASVLLSAVWVLVEISVTHVMLLDLVERTLLSPESLANHFAPLLRCRWCAATVPLEGACDGDLDVAFCRVVLRSAVVWSEVLIAFMLASAGIGDLQALVGAFGFTALTYYAPFAAYWKLIARHSEPLWKQASYAVAFLSGVVLMAVGIYVSLEHIGERIADYSLFDTSICAAQAIVDLASCNNPCHEAYGFANGTCRH
eukprot:TRINITY_DN21615_c0_g1_i1.p1 TRINITY_DN21615_c0_g1~~TRINITY_DN21615_c0_g1_i1.p1  ORF type:complete len:526 (-),score=95.12 TRINITY_DN21615_c0_g1_i1:161-1645(-)